MVRVKPPDQLLEPFNGKAIAPFRAGKANDVFQLFYYIFMLHEVPYDNALGNLEIPVYELYLPQI